MLAGMAGLHSRPCIDPLHQDFQAAAQQAAQVSCSAPDLHEACQCRHVALALPEVRGQEAGQQCQVHLWQRVLVQLNQLRKDLEDVGVELLQQGTDKQSAHCCLSKLHFQSSFPCHLASPCQLHTPPHCRCDAAGVCPSQLPRGSEGTLR